MIGAGHASGGGHVRKVPIAQIAIERVGSVQAAEIQIAETIAIDVTCRDAGTVKKDLIGQGPLLAESIGEGDAGRRRVGFREAVLSIRGNGQRCAPITRLLLPIERCCAPAGR